MSTKSSTAIVFTGGDPDRWPPARLPAADLCIAADSGVLLAEHFGRPVNLVVGDLDSAPPDAVARAEAAGARVDRHPSDKEHTDLELALMAADRAGSTDVLVVGGDGGRLDHLLGNLLLLGSADFAHLAIDSLVGTAHVTVVTPASSPRTITGDAGELVSLIAVGGPARGVVTEGLRYPLAGETLAAGSSRGISNVLTGPTASVAVAAGALLVIQPGVEGVE